MRIALVGNCHAGIIAQAVRAALHGDSGLDCRHIVSFQNTTAEEREFIEYADRVLVQITDFRKDPDLSAVVTNRSGSVGRFPLIACNFIYPGAGKAHPLAASSRSVFCASGHYEAQISDTLLIDTMEKHKDESAESIVDRYLALDYRDVLDLDRLFEINRLKMQRIGAASGLDLWPKIERNYKDAPLFWTYLHPSGALMRDICRHALRQLNLGFTDAEINAALASVKEPLGFAHMPIHPSIVRHFGIEWAPPNYRYRFMPLGSFTAREYGLRYVRFEFDDELNRAIFNVHNDLDLEAATRSLEQARMKYPNSGDVLINLSVAYWKQGLLQQATDAAASAVEIDPSQAEWASFLCIVIRQAGIGRIAA